MKIMYNGKYGQRKSLPWRCCCSHRKQRHIFDLAAIETVHLHLVCVKLLCCTWSVRRVHDELSSSSHELLLLALLLQLTVTRVAASIFSRLSTLLTMPLLLLQLLQLVQLFLLLLPLLVPPLLLLLPLLPSAQLTQLFLLLALSPC